MASMDASASLSRLLSRGDANDPLQPRAATRWLGFVRFEFFGQDRFVAVLDEVTLGIDQEHGRPTLNAVDARGLPLAVD